MSAYVCPVSTETDALGAGSGYPQPIVLRIRGKQSSGDTAKAERSKPIHPSKAFPEQAAAGDRCAVGGSTATADGREAPDGAKPLPCLYSNNGAQIEPNTLNLLTPYHRKQAETLYWNTSSFVELYGLNYVGFLTLTFKDNVTDHHEASRRFKSLNKHFLKTTFGNWILVKERQNRGAWHYHILIDCKTDIRTGFNWKAAVCRDYTSASPALKNLWAKLRKAMPKYGFGRSELMPIRSNKDGIGRYVGKYISKHVGVREERDKGVRLFSSSSGFRPANTNFAWNTPHAWVWRMKVKEFARIRRVGSYGGLQMHFGKRWAFWNAVIIYETTLPRETIFPTVEHWRAYTDLPDNASPIGYENGMTQFKIIDGRAKPSYYDRKTAEFSSSELAPFTILKLPKEQKEMAL